MRTVPQILNIVAKTNSNKKKIELLSDHKYNEVLKEVLFYTLNPFITYGVTEFDRVTSSNKRFIDVWEKVKVVLNDLDDRRITGDLAKYKLIELAAKLTKPERELLRNIIARDLRCGLGAKTVNKVWPGLIPQFDIMLASKDIEPDYPCIVEPKLDGVRCLTIIDDKGNINYFSRKGKEFFNFSRKFNKDIRRLNLRSTVLDGEVTSPDDFQKLMTVVRRKKDIPKDLKIHYVIFDTMSLVDFKNQVPQTKILTRRAPLFKKLNTDLLPSIASISFDIVHSDKELQKLYKYWVDEGYEGIIIKQTRYEFKRSKEWIKVKPTNDVDLKIIGTVEGTGKYKGKLGSIIVKYKGKKVNVGSGFDDNERERKLDWWKGKTAEIAYQEETNDGSLRFPVFKGVRFDK